MKVYMKTPEEVLAMTLAGVQCVCCGHSGGEWPDEVFGATHWKGMDEATLLEHYESNFSSGLRFYVEAE